ncbi:MAG: hypothetical protein QOK90_05475 [Nitrososphaeraceae archaeon]|nr:hypothetical protein [Nitrososphaeraceae archaeon]
MNRKFIFSMAVAMSFILGSGFAIASQTALAVQFSYPYSSSSYNKAYTPNNNTSYDNASYNKAYSPDNNDNNDKYSEHYSTSDEYSQYPTIHKIYECQKGPLEGFFTSSVEFCIAANGNVR